jgi:PAS domain S-box-containing protein
MQAGRVKITQAGKVLREESGEEMGKDRAEGRTDQVFRRIVEESPDSIVMHDAEGVILFANKSAAEALRAKSPSTLAGKNLFEFLPEPEHNKYAALMERTLESGRPFSDVEFPLMAGGSEALIASVSGYPVESQGVRSVVLDIRDVTARKLIEAGLKKQLDTTRVELEALSRRNGQEIRLDAHLVHRIVVVYGSYMMKTALSGLLGDKRIESKYYSYQEEYDPELVEKLKPDIVVFAFSSCGEMEINDIKDLMQMHRMLQVLVVCLNLRGESAIELVKSGVQGLISREEEIRLVPAAINAIAEGELWCARSVLRTVIDGYRSFQPTAGEAGGDEKLLTEREREILRLIARSFRNKEIAEQLGISYYTVVTHIYNIYRKLEVNRRVDAIHYAISNKLIEVS